MTTRRNILKTALALAGVGAVPVKGASLMQEYGEDASLPIIGWTVEITGPTHHLHSFRAWKEGEPIPFEKVLHDMSFALPGDKTILTTVRLKTTPNRKGEA